MRRRRSQRGAAMVTVALWLTAFMGFAALGIDIARVAFTANEVQSVADVAATAGAMRLAMGGTVPQAKGDAQTVTAQNRVDGSTASIAPNDIEVGAYDYTTNTFLPNVAPPSAVRATGRKTVRNVIAGAIGSPTSDVTKVAVGGFKGIGAGQPTFPLALGDCKLQDLLNCFGQDGATCKSFRQIPSGSNTDSQDTAWTSFFLSSNDSNVVRYLPIVYQNKRCVANTVRPPNLKLGDVIQLNNGSLTNVLTTLSRCAPQYKGKAFLMPIVDCTGSFNQAHVVTGFATFVFDGVTTTSSKGIDIRTIFKVLTGPLGGCPTCGTGLVALLQ